MTEIERGEVLRLTAEIARLVGKFEEFRETIGARLEGYDVLFTGHDGRLRMLEAWEAVAADRHQAKGAETQAVHGYRTALIGGLSSAFGGAFVAALIHFI